MGWDGPPTLRHFLLWQSWADIQRHEPDEVCNYLMQLTAELTMVTGWLGVRKKSDMPTKLDDLRLKYVEVQVPAASPVPLSSPRERRGGARARGQRSRVSIEEKVAAQYSRARWHTVLGAGITVRNSDGTLTLPDGSKVDEAEYNASRSGGGRPAPATGTAPGAY